MTTARLTAITAVLALLTACSGDTPVPPSTPSAPVIEVPGPAVPTQERVAAVLAQMTLAEKIGQMTQLEEGSIDAGDVARLNLGSVLHGGGTAGDGSLETWSSIVHDRQREALTETRLGIPLLYGVDAVHGFGALHGATVFPHQIGLGAANDPDLMQRIGRATAIEVAATGIRWNFSPVLAIPDDVRWGRTYEAYSQDPARVSELGTAYVTGLQGANLTDATSVLATPKHFVGDGQAAYGTSTQHIFRPYVIDQGVAPVNPTQLRDVLLPPYQDAIDAGALSVMATFSSWGSTKVHSQRELLTTTLRGDLGFTGFVVSDWAGCDQIDPADFDGSMVACINAGVDMVMVPHDGDRFQQALTEAVDGGSLSMARVDEAVSRILTVKFDMGLFEDPYGDAALGAPVGTDAHRALAREAVVKSQVLLKNDGALPLPSADATIVVVGNAAHDMGRQAGGWTMDWQGGEGDVIPGTTIVEGIEARGGDQVRVVRELPASGTVDVCIAVVGEAPYAEGVGDSMDLALPGIEILDTFRGRCDSTVLVLVTGRPVLVTDAIATADAVVASWLPGTAGEGVADVLFGDRAFSGTLPVNWPRDISQVPSTPDSRDYLFPLGYGLTQ
ncbi:MAG: beta-glucosidase [Actinobacteria bacterium HGW-Actinobacteria-4]|nr:MAG: beta-glucosidase [Actinobacteria bacterium HGW-Actinobacteria-4]